MKKALYVLLMVVFTYNLYAQTGGDKASNLAFSFAERIRIEAWDNATDLNNLGTANAAYMRFKTSLGMQWGISPDFTLTAKITNEFRKYIAPKNSRFHWNELFVDNFYLKITNVLPGTLTIGRQDFGLGEGFIIRDGTPGDGSRSFYFNAVKFDWTLNKTNTLTLLVTYQPFEDNILPVLNGLDNETSSQATNSNRVIEQTEFGAGAYYSGDFGKTNIQGYYFLKTIDFVEKMIVPKSTIHTVGGRMKTPLTDMLSFTAEAALQFGSCGDFSRSAYGGYAYLDYKTGFEPALLPKLATVGVIMLSGDDPTTTNNEGWDPVFSRFPKWSESYIYTQAREFGRAAYWSNLLDIYIKFEFALMKDFDLSFQNHLMMSAQNSAKTTLLSGEGKNRGNLTWVKFSYKMNPNTSGHFIWEHLEPGNYYFTGADNYNWFRFELMINL